MLDDIFENKKQKKFKTRESPTTTPVAPVAVLLPQLDNQPKPLSPMLT